MNPYHYVNIDSNGEKASFQWHFRTEEFSEVSPSEQELHTFWQCKQCQNQPHKDFFLLYRRNKETHEVTAANPVVDVTDPKNGISQTGSSNTCEPIQITSAVLSDESNIVHSTLGTCGVDAEEGIATDPIHRVHGVVSDEKKTGDSEPKAFGSKAIEGRRMTAAVNPVPLPTTSSISDNNDTLVQEQGACVSTKPSLPPTKVDVISSHEFRDRFEQLLKATSDLHVSTVKQCKAIAHDIQQTFNESASQFNHGVELQIVIPDKRRKVDSPNDVSIKCKRAIVSEAQESAKENTIDNDFYSLYTSDQSARGYEKARLIAQKDTTGRKIRNRPPIGVIGHYKYDSSKLMSILIDAEDDFHRLNSMEGRYVKAPSHLNLKLIY